MAGKNGIPWQTSEYQALSKALLSQVNDIVDVKKAENFLHSQLANYLHKQQQGIEQKLSVQNIVKILNRKGNTKGKRYIYGMLRRYINLVREAMLKHGYLVVDVLGRARINYYISLLGKAGYNVNALKPKINIAKLHKKVYKFMNSLDIKLSNPNLFATSTRVTILESAPDNVRRAILNLYSDKKKHEFFYKKSKSVHPWHMPTADLEKQATTIAEQLRRLGFEERLNVSNNPDKPYYRSLKGYCRTWAQDIQTRASFLTTTHLAEETGITTVKIPETPDCCPLCEHINGNIFELDPTGDEDYLPVELPVHPNCHHQAILHHPAFDEMSKKMIKYYDEKENKFSQEEIDTVRQILKKTQEKAKQQKS